MVIKMSLAHHRPPVTKCIWWSVPGSGPLYSDVILYWVCYQVGTAEGNQPLLRCDSSQDESLPILVCTRRAVFTGLL